LSSLTKVFIVLLVIFSIAFTTMTISIATQTANWKEVAGQYEQHARVADTNLRNLIAANAAELASAADAARDRLERIAELEVELESGRTQTEQLRGELRRSAADKSSAEAIQRSSLALLQSSEAERDAYLKQRDDLEEKSIDLQTRNIDLNDRVNELTANLTVLIEQKRQFEQQINVLRNENKRLSRAAQMPARSLAMEEASGAAMSNVTARTPVAISAIRGKIVEVSGDIVTINVGKSDGVEKAMVFVIYRGSEYIGDMKVTLVDPGRSAGRITGSRLMPMAGDAVKDSGANG